MVKNFVTHKGGRFEFRPKSERTKALTRRVHRALGRPDDDGFEGWIRAELSAWNFGFIAVALTSVPKDFKWQPLGELDCFNPAAIQENFLGYLDAVVGGGNELDSKLNVAFRAMNAPEDDATGPAPLDKGDLDYQKKDGDD